VRGDTTPPGVVTGVAASGGANGVTVTWAASAATDLAGYTVYRAASATGTFTKVTTALVTATSLTDTGAPAGATSYYQVTATDTSNNESARSATVSATRPTAPAQQPIRINAGGPAQTVAGTTWAGCSSPTACSGWVTGGFAHSEPDTITGVPAGMNQAVFQSEWTGGQTNGVPVGARAFGFNVPVVNGTYLVRLHFAELNKDAANLRLFDVRLENATMLAGFDVFAAAGGIDRVVTREARTTVTDGAVTLDFITRKENAKVSAIEIVPVDSTPPGAVTGVTATGSATGVSLGWAPSTAGDLAGYDVYRASSATGPFTKLNAALLTGATYVDGTAPAGATSYYQVSAVDLSGNESVRSATVSAARPPAVRQAIRINAGGAAQGVGGTTWSACTATSACAGWVTGGFAYSEPDTITGLPSGTNNALFQSEWTGGQTTGVPVGARAFGFNVPVANGSYLVRLHFAELNKDAANLRLFDVRLEGVTVLAGFDVFAAAGGIDRAVTREYTADITDGAVTLDFITRKENAKVSAIEIVPVG
jgi:PIN domain nuclease of toxin-antitoxin system